MAFYFEVAGVTESKQKHDTSSLADDHEGDHYFRF